MLDAEDGVRSASSSHIRRRISSGTPTGGRAPAMTTSFHKRDLIRQRFAADLLTGRGIEIGAGNAPHPLPPGASCLHYDVRSREELRTLFADNAVVRPR